MKTKAKAYVQQHGGKLGLLLFLAKHGSTAVQRSLLPTVHGKYGQFFIQQPDVLTLGESVEKRGNWDNPELVLRASHPGDLTGLIDALPGLVLSFPDGADPAYLQAKITELEAQLRDPAIARYAANEGTHYRPEDCSLFFQPRVRNEILFITEHPNYHGNLWAMDDIDLPADGVGHGDISGSLFFEGIGSKAFTSDFYGYEDRVYAVELTRQVAKDLGVKQSALQYEVGTAYQHRGHFHVEADMALLQIKWFTHVRDRKQYVPQHYTRHHIAEVGWGTAPVEKRTLIYTQSLYDARRAVRGHEGAPYVLISSNVNNRSLEAMPPASMKGYIAGFVDGMGHDISRFAQAALRHKNGFFFVSPVPVTLRAMKRGAVWTDTCTTGVQWNPTSQLYEPHYTWS